MVLKNYNYYKIIIIIIINIINIFIFIDFTILYTIKHLLV
jgi:hypothetical protein